MSHKFSTIAFDADDTLWENEQFFRVTQARFSALLSAHCEHDDLEDRLLKAEKNNLGRYGFGVKGFVLSMIETAIDVTDAQVPASVIRELIAAGKDMLEHPIHLLDGAEAAVRELAQDREILLVTKGDLLDQERKLAQSGLGDLFDGVEIVSAKTPQVYQVIFDRHKVAAGNVMMIGNSMKSDVIPPIETGAWGTYIASNYAWEVEHAEPPTAHPRYNELSNLGELGELIRELEG